MQETMLGLQQIKENSSSFLQECRDIGDWIWVGIPHQPFTPCGTQGRCSDVSEPSVSSSWRCSKGPRS